MLSETLLKFCVFRFGHIDYYINKPQTMLCICLWLCSILFLIFSIPKIFSRFNLGAKCDAVTPSNVF